MTNKTISAPLSPGWLPAYPVELTEKEPALEKALELVLVLERESEWVEQKDRLRPAGFV